MSRRRSRRRVYLIGSPLARPVKIGVSDDPAARLADLQVGSPVPLLILWQTPGGQRLESALHAYFAPYRLHGEWFDFDEENPVALVATAAVLMGYRAQPAKVDQPARYLFGDCTACAAARVAPADQEAPETKALERPPRTANAALPAPRTVLGQLPGEQMTNRDRVLAAVRQGALTNKAITAAVGIHKGSVSRAVDQLVEAGHLLRHGDRSVSLAPDAPCPR